MDNKPREEQAVNILYYRLETTTPFDSPQTVIGEDIIGRFKLKNDILTVYLSDEYKLIKEARLIVDPIIRSWQLEAEINHHPVGCFRFCFWKAEMTNSILDFDDNIPEPFSNEKDDQGILVIYSREYPPFPRTRFTLEMEAAWLRYRKASIGIGESIQSTAYYALTIAEHSLGNRKKAAEKLRIDETILKKIGELTSTRGSKDTARKSLGAYAKELTKKEKLWIDCAIRLLVLHMGMVNAGEIPEKILMNDLPALNQL